jgi:hypothetical protein
MKKIIAIFSSVLILAGSALPVFADTTITTTGNGSDSTNISNVTVTNSSQVQQTNSANITNTVNSTSDSGGNTASHNTGGDVLVATGNAKTQVSIANTANSNVADVANCNCGAGNLDVKVSGNGAGSLNTTNTALQNTISLGQTNSAYITNDVSKADSNSGKNNAGYNTGGSVMVGTGDASTWVNLATHANQNLAQVGGTTGASSNATSVNITGNGSDSQNKVNLGLTDWVVLGQTNQADVLNYVNAKANTGKNTADHNTGGSVLGDVTIGTGNAYTKVAADTAVNFNEAAVGCDCLMGVTAKIAGNGASDWWGTTSTINANLVNGQQIGQANGGEGIMNDLYGKSSSGVNSNGLNTGSVMDPMIMTGDSTSQTSVMNEGNANIFGNANSPFSNVTLTFSLQDLLLALGLH